MLIAQIFSLFLSASDANCRELIFHREMEGRDGTTLSLLSLLSLAHRSFSRERRLTHFL